MQELAVVAVVEMQYQVVEQLEELAAVEMVVDTTHQDLYLQQQEALTLEEVVELVVIILVEHREVQMEDQV